MNQDIAGAARSRRAWAAAPALAIGGVCGLAWAAGLRGFMAELAGSGSSVGWYGTFAQILLPGVIAGILLGWAEHIRRTGGRRGWRWLAVAPIAFTVAVFVSPEVFRAVLNGQPLLAGGIGGGAIALPLSAMAGGYAISGRGPIWSRIIFGVVAALPVPGWALAASLFGSGFALTTPRGAWIALYFYSFVAALSLACAIPHRPVVRVMTVAAGRVTEGAAGPGGDVKSGRRRVARRSHLPSRRWLRSRIHDEARIERTGLMGRQMRALLGSGLDELRYEPIGKRIRAVLGGETVVDSTHAMLVWEPRRIVPSYAVPVGDVRGELSQAAAAAPGDTGDAGVQVPTLSRRPVLDPSVPFTAHTADGRVVDVRAVGQDRHGAGFKPADLDLSGYVVLDFRAFDGWYEEDEANVSHPRDPFHRIDVLPSSRHVSLELDGQVLADSARPMLLFETMLPVRYYLPREDIRAALTPSDARTFCAYKGQASYWSVTVRGQVSADIAWTYQAPLHDAAQVAGRVAFFDERIDVVVDGERKERPITPWSPRPGT